MIELLQATEEDIIMLAERAVDQTLANQPDLVRYWARMNIQLGPAYKASFDGKTVAVAGLRLKRVGVGTFWMAVDKDVKDYSFAFYRQALVAMRSMIDSIIETYGLKKVRAASRIGFLESQSILNHLGFELQRRATKTDYLYLLRVE